MFPSRYFSTGGDELNQPCYAADGEMQQALSASGETLFGALSGFTQTTHGALAKIEKTPVVWEGKAFVVVVVLFTDEPLEMVLDYNVTTLSNETLVMCVLTVHPPL